MKSNQPSLAGRVKVFAAAVGGSAVVVMGTLGVALHDEQAAGASGGVATGATFIQGGGMTLGRTVTTTTPPSALATPVAVPPVKAKPFGG